VRVGVDRERIRHFLPLLTRWPGWFPAIHCRFN
jgi:hypothetical protein